ncbi:MAG: MBOAT family O-acyltransferase [Pseudomonadota bacterium]|nr:MBOAT family O-acyltransferase [Pseudomonadota bacterium]
MNFVQAEFLWFFGIVFTLYWAFPRRSWQRLWQNVLLTVASAVFYGWVHPWFLGLLYVSAIIDYAGGLGMRRYPAHKKAVLTVTLLSNLALLGYFKYFDFFVENVAAALGALGVDNSLAPLGIFLPAGISFYTFQSMAYSIDVYRNELEPRKNLLDYLLAVSLFCHLVAGPVQRASNLLMQAETPRVFSWAMVRSGFALAMWGAATKIVVADTLSPYVDKIYALPSPSTPLLAAGTLAFAVQILADFAGYSNIARGTARMLGFELMLNFDAPYMAKNPSEFWRRWHISFSSWIRDYVYIPLGGSRGSYARVQANTIAAMVISGIWHGASWNFALWGLYHGLLQVGYRLVTPRIPKSLQAMPGAGAIAIAIMFGFTLFGWFLFRALELHRIAIVLAQDPFAFPADQQVATVVVLAVTLACAAPLVLAHILERRVVPALARTQWWLPAQTTAWAVFALAMFTFVRMSAADFIYFAF